MKDWTEEEEKYLKEVYESPIPIEVICKKLKRSYDSVMKKAQRLFLKRGKIINQNKKSSFFIDWSNVDECTFYVKKHESALKNKLWSELNRHE